MKPLASHVYPLALLVLLNSSVPSVHIIVKADDERFPWFTTHPFDVALEAGHGRLRTLMLEGYM